jgi:hypothetical protein
MVVDRWLASCVGSFAEPPEQRDRSLDDGNC